MTSNQETSIKTSEGSRSACNVYVVLFWLIVALVVFRIVLLPGHFLLTTDDNIGALALRKSDLPRAFIGSWDDSALCGAAQLVMISWTNCLLWLFPVNIVSNWLHALDLLLASVCFTYFLHMRIRNWAACIFGSIVVFWLGSNFTLTYAGHIGKFGILFLASLYLLLIEKAARTGNRAFALLAGGAFGAMFLEQADVAFIFALFLGPYAIYAFIRERGFAWSALIRFLLPLLIVTALLSLHPLWQGFRANVLNVAAVQDEDPRARWAFATQWSWPPEESIDFIAPGFMGWRTGEPDGPYYGRMGRSEGWEQTKRGFRNFKLENQYLGAVPLVFAVFGIFAAWVCRRQKSYFHADVIFWGIVAIVALFLSFGKYFPLYSLFFKLPVVSAIRNPNKFLHVFQLATGVLAAYGVNTALCQSSSGSFDSDILRKTRYFVYALVATGGLLMICALGSTLSWDSLVQRFVSDGWGQLAHTIVRNRSRALIHGGLMVFLAAAGISILSLWKTCPFAVRRAVPWILVGLVLIDVFYLSRYYVKTMPDSALAENHVTRLLKSGVPEKRAALASQDGFYNFWLTYLFPYHGISTVNITQMPRMPEDYKQFLGALRMNPFRLWQLSAVGYVLGPSGLWGQISNDPVLKDAFDIVFAYNVVSSSGVITVLPASQSQPGQHCVLRLKKASPRFVLLGQWQIVEDPEALRLLASNDFPLFEGALISTDSAGGLPNPMGQGIIGSVQLVDYHPGFIKLKASTHLPALLRVSEKYDKDWNVTVNGQTAPLRRVDYLFQGVFVEPGVNEVIFSYAPETWTLAVQLVGMLICVGAVICILRGRGTFSVTARDS